jgi:hypothetical protein
MLTGEHEYLNYPLCYYSAVQSNGARTGILSRIIYSTSLRLTGRIQKSFRFYNSSRHCWGGQTVCPRQALIKGDIDIVQNSVSRRVWLVQERLGPRLGSGFLAHPCIVRLVRQV